MNQLFSALLLFSFASGSLAAPLDAWHWRNPSPFADSPSSICFGAGKFVCVGKGGAIHISVDGQIWTDVQRPVATCLNKVIFANGLFLAVGENGVILVSTNGTAWVREPSGTTDALFGIAFGQGKYVAVGAGGRVTVSANASAWTPLQTGSADLKDIAFGNGVFVIPELPVLYGQMHVLVSTDGQSWNQADLPSVPIDVSYPVLKHLGFGNGVFVAAAWMEIPDPDFPMSWYPSLTFFTSMNGSNWVKGATAATRVGDPSELRFLRLANGLFDEFTANLQGTASALCSTPDGLSSATHSVTSAVGGAIDMASGNGCYMLIGPAGNVWTSVDATNWTSQFTGPTPFVRQVVRGPDKYVAVAGGYYYSSVNEAASPILTSSNGLSFSVVPGSPVLSYHSIAFDGSNYVAVARDNSAQSPYVYTSTNGEVWVPRTSNTTTELYKLSRGPARWAIVGAGGAVITSPNTLAWTLRSSGTANDLHGIAYGNGKFVAVGANGTVVSSSDDGASWDVEYSGTTATLLDVQFLNGQFFAVGYDHGVGPLYSGIILRSADGGVWEQQLPGVGDFLTSVTYGAGNYLICGYAYDCGGAANVMLVSTNGTNWNDMTSSVPAGTALNSVAFLSDGTFWVTGDQGTILQSDSMDGLPRLTGSILPGNSGFATRITLNVPPSYRIQVCTNTATWLWNDAATITTPTPPYIWIDPKPCTDELRLYRVAVP